MKKIIILLVFTLLLTGCNKISEEERENAIKEIAIKYYEKYSKGLVLPVPDNFEVSIEKLEAANTSANAGFDLELLTGCSKESKVTLLLDDNGEVTQYIYALDCDK
jgi:hypothetical protein